MTNQLVFLSPEQQEMLKRVKSVSQKITARVKTGENGLELELNTDDPEASQLIPQIRGALVSYIAGTLYRAFLIGGEVVKNR